MKPSIEERAILFANHVLAQDATIRETAKVFGYSKTCVHEDLSERLPQISIILSKRVKEVLEAHTEVRHVHGGESTRRKYLEMRG